MPGFHKGLLNSTALTRAGMAVGLLVLQGVTLGDAEALPQQGQVVGGSATIVQASPTTLNVTQSSANAVIDWNSFSIGRGETTNFIQPGASSIAVNRVTGVDPSSIMGRLNANGQVVLINPNGILFARGAQVNVGGLVASTSGISNANAMAGKLVFDQAGKPGASVTNAGTITARDGGLVALVAPNVANSGIIRAHLGKVALASGDKWTLDLYGDRLVSFDVTDQVNGTAANSGRIQAGEVEITANAAKGMVGNAINNTGSVQATSVRQEGGTIVLDGGDNGDVAVSGTLQATGGGTGGSTGGSIQVTGHDVALTGATVNASGVHGGGTIEIGGGAHGTGALRDAANVNVDANSRLFADALASGNGGTVIVWSNGTTQFLGDIFARGGAQSGDGGYAETSGHAVLDAAGYVDLTAAHGAKGTYLLDPSNITIYGNVTPAFDSSATITNGTQVDLSGSLLMWLDASDTSKVVLSYNSLGTTASGTAGGNTITVGSSAGLVVGERVQLGGGTDTQLASVNDASGIYTITAISGTTVTLDAHLAASATGATLYGGYVSQLTDKSSQGNNAVQATQANMPLWISNGPNGLGTAQYNGSNDYLTSPVNIGPSYNPNLTFFSTASSTTTGTAEHNIYGNDSGGYGRSVGLDYRCATNFCYFNGSGVGTYFSLSQANTYYTLSQTWTAAAFSASANGHSYVNNAAASNPNGQSYLSIGREGSYGQYWSGNIPEMITYNTALSANAQALVTQYQSAKWGVALAGPGVIGGETGLTGGEAQQAMASTQAGATSDGYSVFSASYLTRLSQTSNIVLQAGNNIDLDLQGATLSLAAGKSITLTAGNQIVTDSAGGIATTQSGGAGGNITLNATQGIVINNAFALNSGGGAVNLNGAITLNAGLTIAAGSGNVSFAGTVDGDHNLSASGGTLGFAGALGGTTPLAAVTLASANTLSLPSIRAASIVAQTTGVAADIDIGAGDTLSASGSGNAITLAAGRNFVNASAVPFALTGGGRWLVYSANPASDTFDGLAASFNRYSCSYAGACPSFPAAGNGLLYSYTPLLNVTPDTLAITYGGASPNLAGYAYTLSGYLGSDAAADSTTGTLGGATSYAQGDGAAAYAITHSSGALASALGYGFTYVSGTLNVGKAPLTVTPSGSQTYGGGNVAVSYGYTGLIPADAGQGPSLVSGLGYTTTAGANSPVAGSYSATATGGVAANYTITDATGAYLVNRAPLTVTPSGSQTYGGGNVAVSYGYTGLIPADAGQGPSLVSGLGFFTNATNASAVGSYMIGATGGVAANYSITDSTGAYIVNPATLTVTVNDAGRLYGAANPAFAATVSGLVLGQGPSIVTGLTYATAATAASNAGDYLVTAAGGTAPNYLIVYDPGVLGVAPAPLVITANNVSRNQGSADPAFSATFSGLVGGDTPASVTGLSFLATDQAGSRPGSYALTAYRASDPNYVISYAPGTVTVTPFASGASSTPSSPASSGLVLSQVVDNQIFQAPDATSNPGVAGQSLLQAVTQNYSAAQYNPDSRAAAGQTERIVCLKGGGDGSDEACAGELRLRGF